jgi:hypothetical protein
MSWEAIDQTRLKLTRYFLTGITVLLILFLLLAFARIGFIFWLWSTVETWVTVRLGLDYYAAQLVTTIVVSLVTILLPSLAWFVLLGKKQLWGTGAMIGGQTLVFILVYTVGSGVCFDRRTGAPLCWYADTPEGRQFSFTPGFHPKYGIEYKQYTREMALQSGSNPPPSAPSSTPPVIRQVKQPETRTVTIDSRRMWIDTGIDVTGKRVRIRYESGQWRNHPTAAWNIGNGLSPYEDQHLLIVPRGALAELVGKTNSGAFPVGTSYEGSPGSGRLYLSINDLAGYFNDNAGSITVTISVSE